MPSKSRPTAKQCVSLRSTEAKTTVHSPLFDLPELETGSFYSRGVVFMPKPLLVVYDPAAVCGTHFSMPPAGSLVQRAGALELY